MESLDRTVCQSHNDSIKKVLLSRAEPIAFGWQKELYSDAINNGI